jgi:hypothetical protein
MTKKTKAAIAALLVVLGVEVYFAARWWMGRERAAAPAERVSLKDEDAAPAPEPALSVLVNERESAMVMRGGPLWVTVGVTQRHAVNVAAKIRLLRGRQTKVAGDEPNKKLQAAVAALEGAMRLKVGGGGRAWTEALEVALRPVAGGTETRWALRVLAARPQGGDGTAMLDEESSAEAQLAPETVLESGDYVVRACLGDSGAWKGRACSELARLTVVGSVEQLGAEQRARMDAEAVRVALLKRDWGELERRGKAMMARDAAAGRMALGDAYFGQEKWEQSLNEYAAARALWTKRGGEAPHALHIRMARLLEKLGAEE